MNTRQKIYDMLEHFGNAMLVTRGPGARFEARPMKLAEVEPAGDIWLLSSGESRKVAEIGRDAHVLLVCDNGQDRFLSMSGIARIVDDPTRLRRVFKESYRVWFPEGAEEPGLVLIAIRPDAAEYWDGTGPGRLRAFWEAAKVAAGEPPNPDGAGGDHGRTPL